MIEPVPSKKFWTKNVMIKMPFFWFVEFYNKFSLSSYLDSGLRWCFNNKIFIKWKKNYISSASYAIKTRLRCKPFPVGIRWQFCKIILISFLFKFQIKNFFPLFSYSFQGFKQQVRQGWLIKNWKKLYYQNQTEPIISDQNNLNDQISVIQNNVEWSNTTLIKNKISI